jgi:glycosyltransferase involved in cell wall biosynthesis
VRLLIAIPVYNERKYVGRVLDKIRSFHRDVLVVDDGSTDGTSEILAARAAAGDIHLIRHQPNQGYGQSLIDAFEFADARGYDWVITMDCDEQHEPEKIPDFIREIETDRWDLISGSRYLRPEGDGDLPPGDRRTINANITAILNELFRLNLTDAFCGYKAHRVAAMRRLTLDVPGYAFPMQLWPQVAHAKLRLTEIPVRLIYNDPTRHFGGRLDDASNRLRHYLSVLHEEMERISPEQPLGANGASRREGLARPEAERASRPMAATPPEPAREAAAGCCCICAD